MLSCNERWIETPESSTTGRKTQEDRRPREQNAELADATPFSAAAPIYTPPSKPITYLIQRPKPIRYVGLGALSLASVHQTPPSPRPTVAFAYSSAAGSSSQHSGALSLAEEPLGRATAGKHGAEGGICRKPLAARGLSFCSLVYTGCTAPFHEIADRQPSQQNNLLPLSRQGSSMRTCTTTNRANGTRYRSWSQH